MIAHRSCLPVWVFLALALVLGLPASAVTVDQIPDPRPAGWVVDLTGTLPVDAVSSLNQRAEAVRDQTGAELAVVVIPTTGGEDSHAFATRLFNTWKLGDRFRNDGLLLFAALDDHRADIVLGTGVDSDRQVRESEAILQGLMIPRFRAGDVAGALREGAQACAVTILGFQAVPAPAAPPRPVPLPGPHPAPRHGRTPLSDFLAVLLPLLAVAGVGVGLWLAVRPPRCPHCRAAMTKLDEAADDAFFNATEQLEERLRSVDHQIWTCGVCGERLKRRQLRWASRYDSCPRCSARALKSITTVLTTAGYDQEGLERIDQECLSCFHRLSFTHSTPRLPRPASPSPFSSAGIGGHSTGFGGGRSAGRGASGRW